MVKNSKFFRTFWPTLADLDGFTPECAQVWALHIEPHLEALRKIEMVVVLCTTETTPIFWVFNSPSTRPLPGADGPQRGRGTSADIVPIRMKFGVDPSTRCWDIAQKPPKCKKFPIDSYSNGNFHFLFFRPPGAAKPQNGRRHIRNQYTSACKLWHESARGLSRNRWPNKKNTVKLIHRPSL